MTELARDFRHAGATSHSARRLAANGSYPLNRTRASN